MGNLQAQRAMVATGKHVSGPVNQAATENA
jgi:hypothetical protein